MKKLGRRYAWALVGGATLCILQPARAQTALGQEGLARAGQAQPAEADGSADIVVTARQRKEALEEVPAAITAFNADQIARLRINGVDDLARFTPGLQTAEAAVSSGGSISLRGIGSGSTNYLGDQAVSINIDGMQVGTLNVRKTAQIDLAQIEVLRGPQALFFGKNSPGGVISFKTADPGKRPEFAADGGLEAVSGDRYVQAIASGPVSDTLGVRLVARYTDLNGYFRLKTVPSPGDPLTVPPAVDRYPTGDEYFVRGTILFEPSAIFKLNAKLSYTKTYNRGGSFTAAQRYNCPYGAPQLQPVFPCVADRDIYIGSGPASLTALVREAERSDGLGFRRNDQWLATVRADLTVAPHVVATYIGGYYRFNELNAHDASVGPRALLLVPYLPFRMSQYTQELRVVSSWASPLNFTVGAFYESRDTFGAQNAVITFTPTPFAVGTEKTFQKQEAVSVYGQLLWRPVPALELSGGVRFTSENKQLRFLFNDTDVTGNLARRSISFQNASPEATITYHVAPRTILFASYKQGFKSGGFDAGFTNGAIAVARNFDNTFREEKVSGGEGGVKFGGRNLTISIVGYRYDYKDLQVGAYDAATISFKVLNAARARIQGIEADASWRTPLPGLTLQSAGAFNDAKFRQFRSGCYVGQTPTLGCNLTPNAAGVFQEQDLARRQLNNAPRFSATGGAVYRTRLTHSIGAELSVSGEYSSSYSANLRQSPQDLQRAYGKLNASLRLFGDNDAWALSIVGRNLTDKYIFNASGPVTLTGNGSGFPGARLADETAFVLPGRELFLTLTIKPGLFR